MEMGIVKEYLPRITDEGVRIQTVVDIPRHIVCNRLHLAHDIGDTQGCIVKYLHSPLHRILTDIVLGERIKGVYRDAENQHYDKHNGKSEPDRQPLHDISP